MDADPEVLGGEQNMEGHGPCTVFVAHSGSKFSILFPISLCRKRWIKHLLVVTSKLPYGSCSRASCV